MGFYHPICAKISISMDSLISYWRFNDVQAGKVFDSSGRNNVGTLASDASVSPKPLHAGNPISDEDEWGEKVPLGHSVTGEIFCGDLQLPSESDSITAELYVRRLGSTDNGNVVPFVSLNGRVSLSLTDQSDILVDADGAQRSTGKRLVIKEWTHIAVVASGQTLRFYLGGTEIFTQNVDLPLVSGPCSISIGAKVAEITEVRVWSCARSEAELRQYMTTSLPRPAGASKWKGLRINQQADASWRSWSKQIPQGASVPVNQTRRVFEKSLSGPRSILDENVEIPINVAVEPVIEEPRPVQSPKPQIASPNSQEEVEAPKPAALVAEPVQVPKTVEAPKQSTTVPEIQTPPNRDPILVPVQLPEALKLFDNLLEKAILNRGFALDKSELLSILQAISGYVRSQYRVGPYLAPMPPEDVLMRLRICVTYLGLINVFSCDSAWGSLAALRLPLLSEHIPAMLFSCIEEARRKNQQGSLSALARILIRECGQSLTAEQVDHIRAYLSVTFSQTEIACPFCTTKLRDPLQTACSDGCGTKFAVCSFSGRIAPADDCAKCRICCTTVSVKPISLPRSHGNVPTNVSVELPKACFMCGCMGSLVPLS